jgi:hypothetical protein
MKVKLPKPLTSDTETAVVPQEWQDQARSLLLKAPNLSETARAGLLGVLVKLRGQFLALSAGTFPVRQIAHRVRTLNKGRQGFIDNIRQQLLTEAAKLRPEFRERCLGLAQEIDELGIAASTTGPLYAELHHYPIGTRGGAASTDRGALRGQQIVRIDKLYPDLHYRNARIAELMRHIGFTDTRSDHVNSIIRQSRRQKKQR